MLFEGTYKQVPFALQLPPCQQIGRQQPKSVRAGTGDRESNPRR